MKKTNQLSAVMVCVILICASSLFAQDWPQWRGPNRDGKVRGFKAPRQWPNELTQKWKKTVGQGDATPALVGDKLYVFTRQGDEEVTLCLDAGSGDEIWKDKYAAQAVTGAARRHPGPRSSPSVANGKVLTIGVGGEYCPASMPRTAISSGVKTPSLRLCQDSSPLFPLLSLMEWQ
jgi:outer membrane protein assembly factor BamB